MKQTKEMDEELVLMTVLFWLVTAAMYGGLIGALLGF